MNLWLKLRIASVHSVHKKMRGGLVGVGRVKQASVIGGAFIAHVGIGGKSGVNFKTRAVGEHGVEHGVRAWRFNGSVRH